MALTLNHYPYAGNDPISFVDPSGLNRQGPTCGAGVDCSWNGGGGGGDWLIEFFMLAFQAMMDDSTDFGISGGSHWSNGEWQSANQGFQSASIDAILVAGSALLPLRE